MSVVERAFSTGRCLVSCWVEKGRVGSLKSQSLKTGSLGRRTAHLKGTLQTGCRLKVIRLGVWSTVTAWAYIVRKAMKQLEPPAKPQIRSGVFVVVLPPTRTSLPAGLSQPQPAHTAHTGPRMAPERSAYHAHDLSASFTTSSLSAPFPVISPAQYRTIARIIAAHPPSDTFSWASLEGTYSRLDVDEDEIQPLLLKLSLEVGRSWSDKWESAKASLEERRVLPVDGVRLKAGSLDVLKVRLDNIPRAPRRPPSTPAAAAPQATTPSTTYSSRPKSAPFDAFRPPPSTTPRPARDFLIQSGYGGYHSSSSDDYVGVPRSERSIPLTSASAILSATPRTSLAPKRASLPPPSLPHRPTSELEANGAKFRYLSHVGKGFDKWYTSFVRRQAERAKADESRRVLLLRTFLLKWRERLGEVREVQRGLRDAERAWKRGSLRRGFAKWVGRIEEKRREEERVRMREKEVRREEKESRLREAFEIVRTQWSERARKECFDVRSRSRLPEQAMADASDYSTGGRQLSNPSQHVSAASTSFARLCVSGTLGNRSSRTSQSRRTGSSRREFSSRGCARGSCSTSSRTLSGGGSRSREGIAGNGGGREGAFRSFSSGMGLKLMVSCTIADAKARTDVNWSEWQICSGPSPTSESGNAVSPKSSCVLPSPSPPSLTPLQSLDDHCDAHLLTKSRHLLRTSLTHWRISHRSNLLTRSHALRSAPPLLASCLDKWIDRYEHVEIELEGRATALLNRSSRAVLEGCMSQWIDVLDKRRVVAEEGERFREEGERRRARACLGVWREGVVRRGVDEVKAEVSRTFFLQRKGWNVWVKALWKRRLGRAEEGLVRRKKGEVFACKFRDFWEKGGG